MNLFAAAKAYSRRGVETTPSLFVAKTSATSKPLSLIQRTAASLAVRLRKTSKRRLNRDVIKSLDSAKLAVEFQTRSRIEQVSLLLQWLQYVNRNPKRQTSLRVENLTLCLLDYSRTIKFMAQPVLASNVFVFLQTYGNQKERGSTEVIVDRLFSSLKTGFGRISPETVDTVAETPKLFPKLVKSHHMEACREFIVRCLDPWKEWPDYGNHERVALRALSVLFRPQLNLWLSSPTATSRLSFDYGGYSTPQKELIRDRAEAALLRLQPLVNSQDMDHWFGRDRREAIEICAAAQRKLGPQMALQPFLSVKNAGPHSPTNG